WAPTITLPRLEALRSRRIALTIGRIVAGVARFAAHRSTCVEYSGHDGAEEGEQEVVPFRYQKEQAGRRRHVAPQAQAIPRLALLASRCEEQNKASEGAGG